MVEVERDILISIDLADKPDKWVMLHWIAYYKTPHRSASQGHFV